MQATTQSVATPLPDPQVSRAADLVDYKSASIANQGIVNRPSGSVAILAFDEGQEVQEHTAPFDALVLVLDGVAEITASGQRHRVQAGELILIPADAPHSVKAPQRFKMLLTKIRP